MTNNFWTAYGVDLKICKNVQNRIILKVTKFYRDCIGTKKLCQHEQTSGLIDPLVQIGLM